MFTPPPPWGAFYFGDRGMVPRSPLKSSLYAIIYDLHTETKHTSKVYNATSKVYHAAFQNYRLDVLITELHFVFKNYNCFRMLVATQVCIFDMQHPLIVDNLGMIFEDALPKFGCGRIHQESQSPEIERNRDQKLINLQHRQHRFGAMSAISKRPVHAPIWLKSTRSNS